MGFLYLLGAGERALTFALFVYATPSGLNAVIFPTAYGGDPYTGSYVRSGEGDFRIPRPEVERLLAAARLAKALE